MKRTKAAALALVWLVGSTALAADTRVLYEDPVTHKEADVNGTITEESPAGVKVKPTRGEVKTIPALQIRQIVYSDPRVAPLDFRRPDGALLRALNEAPRSRARNTLLTTAEKEFQSLDTMLKSAEKIHAYLQYRIAQIAAIRAEDDPKQMDAAITALRAFKTDFPSSWEVVPALKTLAQLQEAKGDGQGAIDTYTVLVTLPGAPEEMKRQGQMLIVKMLLRERKFADAERRLQEIERTSSRNDPQHAFVQVYLAQSRIAQGNTAGTREQLTKALQTSNDVNLRALAHNALGDYYRQQKKLDQAFWEYLKVDTLYSQDREEGARALYNLVDLHDKVNNDPVRAEECRAKLASADYAGTYYQRLLGDKGKPGTP